MGAIHASHIRRSRAYVSLQTAVMHHRFVSSHRFQVASRQTGMEGYWQRKLWRDSAALPSRFARFLVRYAESQSAPHCIICSFQYAGTRRIAGFGVLVISVHDVARTQPQTQAHIGKIRARKSLALIEYLPFIPDGYKRELALFPTDDPLDFEYDPDTGTVSLMVLTSLTVPVLGIVDAKQTVRILLMPGAIRPLLDSLPKLQSVLEQAMKGPTKPRSVQ